MTEADLPLLREFRYHVFISHSNDDEALARDIVLQLERAGLKVVAYSYQGGDGPGLDAHVQEAIIASASFVFISSAHTVGLQRGREALRLAVEMDKPILPVLVDDVSAPELPFLVRHLQYLRLSPDTPAERERIADDLRRAVRIHPVSDDFFDRVRLFPNFNRPPRTPLRVAVNAPSRLEAGWQTVRTYLFPQAHEPDVEADARALDRDAGGQHITDTAQSLSIRRRTRITVMCRVTGAECRPKQQSFTWRDRGLVSVL